MFKNQKFLIILRLTCGFVERHDILITENVCIEDSDEWLLLKNHFNLIEQFDDFVNFDDNIALLDLLPVMTLLVASRNYKIMESRMKRKLNKSKIL